MHHWRTNVAVVVGVAAAVSVLSGALLVGHSVRESLRDIAVSRLGRTEHVISSVGFFRGALAAEITKSSSDISAAPLIAASGMVTSEKSGRRAADVLVYGVDERFWSFQRQPARSGVLLSPALMSELGTTRADTILVRVQKPSTIPIESLFGRKDDIGRTVRLTVDDVLPSDGLGEFSLQPRQSEVRALFLPLSRVQRDLGVPDRVNTIVIAGAETGSIADVVRRVVTLEDLGATVAVTSSPESLVVESATGILSEPLRAAVVQAGQAIGFRAIPVFTYLANTIRDGDRRIPYSLVTATDLNEIGSPSSPSSLVSTDSIVLNEWAARELDARVGDTVALDYFLWDAADRPDNAQRGVQAGDESFPSRAWRRTDVSRPSIPASPRPTVCPTGIRHFRSICRVCDRRTKPTGSSIVRLPKPSSRSNGDANCGAHDTEKPPR